MNVPEDARAQSIARVHRMLNKAGEARRWRFEIIQGVARNVRLRPGDAEATIEVDGRQIQLPVPSGRPIALSEGDDVLIAARGGNPCQGLVYFNETARAGSIDFAHKQARRMLLAGAIGVLAAVAIVLTTVLAARGDSHVPGFNVVHRASYLMSIIVSAAILVFSCFVLTIGVHVRKACALVRFVASK